MNSIFCISAGQLIVKKSNSKLSKQNRYLNYGLLSIASTLKAKGWLPIQIQGNFDSPITTLQTCCDMGISDNNCPILISIPSFYAITWVNEFISNLKEVNSISKVIIGGRWVIDNRADLMKNLVPNADHIISGLAHDIDTIVKSAMNKPQLVNMQNNINNDGPLNYKLLYQRELYQPSIEVSRGCGMGCNFCQEKDEKLQPLKKAQKIITEMRSNILVDNLRAMNFYFESSMFIPSKEWLNDVSKWQENNDKQFSWRTESRVDSLSPKSLRVLAKAGLKIIDLGLESASHTLLKEMNKTQRPEKYLKKASILVREAFAVGIKVKINILLTAGENDDSIAETIQWLDRHQQFIFGVSVGPEIVFGWHEKNQSYLDKLFKRGASISHIPTTGVTHLNLSNSIDYKRSIEISNYISQKFMNHEEFFYLKSFSYFARNYEYNDFIRDLKLEEAENLSFSTASM